MVNTEAADHLPWSLRTHPDAMPDITKIGDPVRLRSGRIDGIKRLLSPIDP